MPDREKVINGIHQHCEGSMFDRCGECPYYEIDHESFVCRDMLLNDLNELLKEQEAVIPGIVQDLDGIYATCGICNAKLWKMIGVRFEVNPDEMPKFCPKCGKRVKWDA